MGNWKKVIEIYTQQKTVNRWAYLMLWTIFWVRAAERIFERLQ